MKTAKRLKFKRIGTIETFCNKTNLTVELDLAKSCAYDSYNTKPLRKRHQKVSKEAAVTGELEDDTTACVVTQVNVILQTFIFNLRTYTKSQPAKLKVKWTLCLKILAYQQLRAILLRIQRSSALQIV